MRTSFSRNFFTYTLILLLALLSVGISFQMLVSNYLTQRNMETLKNNCTTISQVTAAYYTGKGISDRDYLLNLSVAAQVSQSDAVICDANGRLLLCSDSPLGCAHQGMVLRDSGILQRVQQQDYVIFTSTVPGLYTDVRYVVITAIRDPASQAFLGFVLVSAPTYTTGLVLERIADTYIFISILVVLVAGIIMNYYARRTTNPLRVLARAATDFGHGDLKARVPVSDSSPEEIRELAVAFNNMAGSLEQSEYQRQEFVANVSHELKTPMTTIGGYVDGILDGTIPPEQQQRYLQIVSDETKRLSRLVRSMLDISRLQEQQQIPEDRKTRFDIGECAGQVLITFEKKITQKDLDVQVLLPEHPIYTIADQDAITQVIYNLMDNAVKFCPTGGVLSLRILQSGSKAYISVANTGPVIPPQELPLVFDRFHKLDKSRTENREGWGLGLYIVKTIVCSHGEDISVTSENGKTEFTFTLPLSN